MMMRSWSRRPGRPACRYRGRNQMADPNPAAAPAPAAERTTTVESPPGLLEEIIREGRIGQSDEEKAVGKAWLKDFIAELTKKTIKVSADTDQMLADRIADLDELISLQLNEVMHS